VLPELRRWKCLDTWYCMLRHIVSRATGVPYEKVTDKMLGARTALDLAGFEDVDDTVLAALARHCRSLRALGISGTSVTDTGLKHCAELVELRVLNLSATGVTNAGLKHIEALANLWCLYVRDTQVNNMGRARLKKKRFNRGLPACCVILQ